MVVGHSPIDEAAMDMELTHIINEFISARRPDRSLALRSPSRKPSLTSSPSRRRRYGGMWRFAARAIIKKRCDSFPNSEETMPRPLPPIEKTSERNDSSQLPRQGSGSSVHVVEDQDDVIAKEHGQNWIPSTRNPEDSLPEWYNFSPNSEAVIKTRCNCHPKSEEIPCSVEKKSRDNEKLDSFNKPRHDSCIRTYKDEQLPGSSHVMENQDDMIVAKEYNNGWIQEARSSKYFLPYVADESFQKNQLGALVAKEYGCTLPADSDSLYIEIPPEIKQSLQKNASDHYTSPNSSSLIMTSGDTLQSRSMDSLVAPWTDTNQGRKSQKPLAETASNIPRSVLKHSCQKPPRHPRLFLSRSGSYRAHSKTAARRARAPETPYQKRLKIPKTASSTDSPDSSFVNTTTICALIVTIIFIAIIFVQGIYQ